MFFLVLLRWLDLTFRTFSAIPWPLTWLPTLALAAYCGLYIGAVVVRGRGLAGAAAVDRVGARPRRRSLWVGGEWLRGHLLGGFPWGTLGYSQHLRLPVIQIAELGGVYAVSFLIVAVNAALAGLLVLGVAARAGRAGRRRRAARRHARLRGWRLRRAAAAGRGAGRRHAAVDRADAQVRSRPHAPSILDDLRGADAAGGRRAAGT